jgi:hypothetical protein
MTADSVRGQDRASGYVLGTVASATPHHDGSTLTIWLERGEVVAVGEFHASALGSLGEHTDKRRALDDQVRLAERDGDRAVFPVKPQSMHFVNGGWLRGKSQRSIQFGGHYQGAGAHVRGLGSLIELNRNACFSQTLCGD